MQDPRSGAPSGAEPRPSAAACLERRTRLGRQIGGGALILFGGELKTRSADTEYRFRPDSDFFYLTGLAEPRAVLVFRPQHDPALTLFVRPRDPDAEVWSGRRTGPDGARTIFGADAAHPIGELDEHLPKLLDGVGEVYMPIGAYPTLDRAVLRAMGSLRRRNRTGETAPEVLRDTRGLMGRERMVKDDAALQSLRRAIDITVQGHLAAMRSVRPGATEFEIEARIEYEFRRRGSSGPGYASIVGAGANATILHYVDNDMPLRAGELLLVDAGAEWDLLTGDLTRTSPIDGRFRPAQRDLYEVVLAANQAGIAACTVGGDIDAIHQTCLRVLAQGLVDLRLLPGTVDEVIEHEHYKKYYMHRTSHWLGVDVHDVGDYTIDRRPRRLEAGYVLTVEPALYVAADDETAPAELRGCGIRIEDDVLVRPEGPEILTFAAPKRVDDLEAIVGSDAG